MTEPIVKLTEENTELFIYMGKEIETDRKDDRREDNVLPIYPGSGVYYLIDHLLVKNGDTALDLCTGSGVLGIYAADKASKVVATDISTRALKFAQKNAERNHIENIEFRQGDLFEPVKGEKFDYIIANPPFVPMPDHLKAALHSKGGLDGLNLVRRILEQVENYLKPGGIMQLYSLTLGTQETTILEGILRKHLKNRKVTMISLYSSPLPVEEFVSSFKKYEIDGWENELKTRGITHLHLYIVNIEPGRGLEIIKTLIPEDERSTFSDWDKWKGRFSYWVLNK